MAHEDLIADVVNLARKVRAGKPGAADLAEAARELQSFTGIRPGYFAGIPNRRSPDPMVNMRWDVAREGRGYLAVTAEAVRRAFPDSRTTSTLDWISIHGLGVLPGKLPDRDTATVVLYDYKLPVGSLLSAIHDGNEPKTTAAIRRLAVTGP
ncbi:hypothetical protein FF36_00173 [Frankia torreyi]|uniref:Uncharacterized protein n=1 Tax=Frankia torreyi TaxID=1856 RepID=A0A0D8BQ84_9ACTN|nr:MULTISPECIES: hypothetical protein [Frankia]KJE25557.1 hypothetical protein FF36_00173 [Frankia torreyi]KQM06201.1 hypothetical protein FF86_101078 [Frankia sp. CpI1-P]